MRFKKVVVGGGGYAGVMCALRLAGKSRGRLEITLVNPRENFVERLRLHEKLTVRPKYEMRSFCFDPFLKRRGITFINGQVITPLLSEKAVVIEISGRTVLKLGYDRLVIASGSCSALDHVPGQIQHSYAMNTGGARGAEALARALGQSNAPRVSIVGGGATGIELAAEIAQKPGARVTLLCRSELGAELTEPVRRRVRAQLTRQGVAIREHAHVASIAQGHLVTGAQQITHDLCVCASGFEVDPMWAAAGLETLPNGRIVTDAYLRAVKHPEVYAAGDAAYCAARKSAPSRMSVMFAMASGAHVADAVVDEAGDKTPRRFGFWTYGQAIGLGPHAVGFGNMRYDTAYAPYFTGRTGYHLRHFFVAMLFRLLLLEAKMPGFPFYLGRPLGRDRKAWAGE